MLDDDSDKDGPSFEFQWNFPLIRVLTKGGERVGAKFKSVRGDSIPDRIMSSKPKVAAITDDDDGEERDNSLDNLREDIQNLRDGNSTVAEQSSQPNSASVTYNGETFAPIRSSIQVGGSIEWTNESDTWVTILNTNAPADFSLILEPGQSDTLEFNDEGVHEYMLSDESPSDVCGAVLVGDPEDEPTLPCEEDIERQIFTSSSSDRSLSEAAEEKEREF